CGHPPTPPFISARSCQRLISGCSRASRRRRAVAKASPSRRAGEKHSRRARERHRSECNRSARPDAAWATALETCTPPTPPHKYAGFREEPMRFRVAAQDRPGGREKAADIQMRRVGCSLKFNAKKSLTSGLVAIGNEQR